MIKRLVAPAIAIAAMVAAPLSARADTSIWDDLVCTATSTQACLRFDLSQIGGIGSLNYSLVLTYASSDAAAGESGRVTAFGLYDVSASPAFSFSNIAVSNTADFTTDPTKCNDLNPVTNLLACTSGKHGNDGVTLGNSLTLSFTSNAFIQSSDFGAGGPLGVRAHLQAFGPNGCSLKPDSRSATGMINTDAEVTGNCGLQVIPPPPSTTTPEPISMMLLGSGLLGVGAIRRRRRGGEVVSD